MFGFLQEHPRGDREAHSYKEEVCIIASQLWGPQNTNLVRTAQVLHPWHVLQAVFFRTAEVFWAAVALFDVQQAIVCSCRQLEVQTLRLTGEVLLRAALADGSFLIALCRRFVYTTLLLDLLAATSSRLLSSLCICRRTRHLAVTQSCVLVSGAWALQDGLMGGACDETAPPGQTAVARFFRRSETWPLARSWIIVPVKLRKTGFPGFGGHQRPSFQGAITEIVKKRDDSTFNPKKKIWGPFVHSVYMWEEYLPMLASHCKHFIWMLQLQLLHHILEVLSELKVKRSRSATWGTCNDRFQMQLQNGTVCISLKKMFCKLDMDENTQT